MRSNSNNTFHEILSKDAMSVSFVHYFCARVDALAFLDRFVDAALCELLDDELFDVRFA